MPAVERGGVVSMAPDRLPALRRRNAAVLNTTQIVGFLGAGGLGAGGRRHRHRA